jgi:general secretion pathway protein K
MAGLAMSRMRGAAIVLAMLIAALAAAVAATVFADQQRWLRTVEHRRDQVQAQALAMAGVLWTSQILDEDARRSTIDHLGEPWALTLPSIPLENGEVRGTIVDAQGRLNINALGATDASAEVERARLARLIAQKGMPPAVLAAMADWIDADGVADASGAEDAFYLAQSVPRLAANAPVLRVAELGAVKGVTPRMLAALLPYLSALPAGTPVNVNTAPREVLAAIVENAGNESLEALVADRARKPFTTIAEFRARLPDGSVLASDVALSVKSNYFYVTIEARQGATRAHARALLRRGGGGKPTIVWQVVE